MIIYKSTAADFRNVCFTRSISAVIEESFKLATHRNVGQSEINAWGSSLQHVAIALNDKLIPDDAGSPLSTRFLNHPSAWTSSSLVTGKTESLR